MRQAWLSIAGIGFDTFGVVLFLVLFLREYREGIEARLPFSAEIDEEGRRREFLDVFFAPARPLTKKQARKRARENARLLAKEEAWERALERDNPEAYARWKADPVAYEEELWSASSEYEEERSKYIETFQGKIEENERKRKEVTLVHRRRKLFPYLAAVALVLFGAALQIVGNWPGGISALGISPVLAVWWQHKHP